MRWDIFCRVIDNHGDLGVCWRLAAELAQRDQQVRLWVDEPEALRWMAPQLPSSITVVQWPAPPSIQGATRLTDGAAVAPWPGDVVIEAFGCEIDPLFITATAPDAPACAPAPIWLNLEYLSAESFVERNHRLLSPVMSGPAAGMRKHFFYPGFTERTGGLLRENDLAARQQQFQAALWRQRLAIPQNTERVVSLFCYEPTHLKALLTSWSTSTTTTHLLVTPGRAQAALAQAWSELALPPPTTSGLATAKALSVQQLPYFDHTGYDELLWSCDLNFVRGEDSLVRALWAGLPFVWQIYPQHDDAHLAKLEAFLALWLDGAPAALQKLVRSWHTWWNEASNMSAAVQESAPALSSVQLQQWQQWARCARQRLWQQDDLCTQLIRFVEQTG